MILCCELAEKKKKKKSGASGNCVWLWVHCEPLAAARTWLLRCRPCSLLCCWWCKIWNVEARFLLRSYRCRPSGVFVFVCRFILLFGCKHYGFYENTDFRRDTDRPWFYCRIISVFRFDDAFWTQNQCGKIRDFCLYINNGGLLFWSVVLMKGAGLTWALWNLSSSNMSWRRFLVKVSRIFLILPEPG